MPRAALSPATRPIPALLNAGARHAAAARAALASDARFALTEVESGRLADLVALAVESGAPRVLVAGGDGSLRGAAEVLRGSRSALAVLPAGTRNHFARDHGIPLDPSKALDVAAHGHIGQVDLGSVNGRMIANTSSVGAYAGYVQLRRRIEPWMGYHAASLAAGLVSLRSHGRFAVTLEAQGKHLRYEAALVFVGVGERSLERPSPGARRVGGRRMLHVFVVHERSRARIAGLIMRAVTRGIPFLGEERGVHSFLVESCEVELRSPEAEVALDGELIRLRTPLRYRMHRDALRVVLPPPVMEAVQGGPDRASHRA